MFIIIAFGDSVAAMYTLYDPSPYKQAYWGVCISWGLAVTIAIYVTGSVSGCHANPAVTLALAVYRKFEWVKVVPYVIAQVIGGFAGAVIVYALFGRSSITSTPSVISRAVQVEQPASSSRIPVWPLRPCTH